MVIFTFLIYSCQTFKNYECTKNNTCNASSIVNRIAMFIFHVSLRLLIFINIILLNL